MTKTDKELIEMVDINTVQMSGDYMDTTSVSRIQPFAIGYIPELDMAIMFNLPDRDKIVFTCNRINELDESNFIYHKNSPGHSGFKKELKTFLKENVVEGITRKENFEEIEQAKEKLLSKTLMYDKEKKAVIRTLEREYENLSERVTEFVSRFNFWKFEREADLSKEEYSKKYSLQERRDKYREIIGKKENTDEESTEKYDITELARKEEKIENVDENTIQIKKLENFTFCMGFNTEESEFVFWQETERRGPEFLVSEKNLDTFINEVEDYMLHRTDLVSEKTWKLEETINNLEELNKDTIRNFDSVAFSNFRDSIKYMKQECDKLIQYENGGFLEHFNADKLERDAKESLGQNQGEDNGSRGIGR